MTAQHESTWIDKTSWGDGPWQKEPDKTQWVDETGLACLAVRHNTSGHWCGYVGVPKGHPYFGKGYNDIDAEVHGGLTYAEPCREDDKEHGVCHVGPEHLHWFGFDCHHYCDFAPGFSARKKTRALSPEYGVYRDLAYVKAQCHHLASQLAAAAKERTDYQRYLDSLHDMGGMDRGEEQHAEEAPQ